MIEQARARLGDDRVEYLVADLQGPLPLEPAGGRGAVDGDVPLDRSTTTRCSANLAACCGRAASWRRSAAGAGNIASIEAALR